MKYFFIKVLLLFLSFSSVLAQDENLESEYYTLFDAYMGSMNFGAFNGREYHDAYPELMRTAKENNKFFGSYNFTQAFVLYNQQPFYDLRIKYDLLNDVLLLKYVNNSVHLLELNSQQVNEFKIFGYHFKRLPFSQDIRPIYGNGFFKEVFKGKKCSLYIKYRKKTKERLDQNKVRYEFLEDQYYVIHYENKYQMISSQKNLINGFPTLKKIIKSFYKDNASMKRKNKEQFYMDLVKRLDNLKPQNEIK